MQNIFHIVKVIPSRKDVVSDKILPRMREIFLSKSKSEERDSSKEAALIAVLNNIQLIADNCSAKQFKDDVLPIVHVAMESSTHSLTDAALQTLPVVLPLIDFSTVKHDLFPVVANVFSKTNSLSIKIQGLEALGVLCGASTTTEKSQVDDYSGTMQRERQEKNVSSLDKFTMQEKVVPLLKGIKTKEPAVMMAGLKVLRQIGQVADTEFLALEVMPILWTFSLGPLLDLSQFRAFFEVIKALSTKVEQEQTRKLGELSSSRSTGSRTLSNLQASTGSSLNRALDNNGGEEDFEKLVLGSKGAEKNEVFAGAFSDGQKLTPNAPTFSWSSVSTASNAPSSAQARPSIPSLQPQPTSRSITPDVSISAFPSLQPAPLSSAPAWGASSGVPLAGLQQRQQPLQPTSYFSSPPISPPPPSNSSWQLPPPPSNSSWQLPPPPSSHNPARNQFPQAIPPPPQSSVQQNPWQQTTYMTAITPSLVGPPSSTNNILQPQSSSLRPNQQPQQKQGLDRYESLL
jgi:SCY1-like protein 2